MNSIGCGHLLHLPPFPILQGLIESLWRFTIASSCLTPFERVRSFERCALVPFQQWAARLAPFELVGKATAC